MPKILVTGGTGVLGRVVAHSFLSKRIDFTLGSRHRVSDDNQATNQLNHHWKPMDLNSRESIVRCCTDEIDTVLHLASDFRKINGQPADIICTKNLLNVVQKTNVNHLVYVSIVGVDRIPLSYYRTKLDCERLIEKSGIPFTILRATQFHDFVEFVLGRLLSFPIGIVPYALKVQPIQVEAVAAELFKIIHGLPQKAIIELGGKEIFHFKQITDSLLKARHQNNKRILNFPVIGAVMKGFAHGHNTCKSISSLSNTWEQYLNDRYDEKGFERRPIANYYR